MDLIVRISSIMKQFPELSIQLLNRIPPEWGTHIPTIRQSFGHLTTLVIKDPIIGFAQATVKRANNKYVCGQHRFGPKNVTLYQAT